MGNYYVLKPWGNTELGEMTASQNLCKIYSSFYLISQPRVNVPEIHM